MSHDSHAIAIAYLDAISKKELGRLDALVAPEVRFVGPASTITGRAALVAALQKIGAVHVRTDVQRVFHDGDEVCVIYDFVTDVVGAVSTVEWLRLVDGRIASVHIYYDQVPWLKVREALAARSTQAMA